MPFSRQAFSDFPFDDEGFGAPREFARDRDFMRNRDHSFRSQLDDIAKRHPELAEHLSFSGIPSSWSRNTRRGSEETPGEFSHRRFGGRPFGNFEEFTYSQPEAERFSQGNYSQGNFPHSHKEEYSGPPEQQEGASGKPPQVPQSERSRKGNIQQSNTVDLGQKSESLGDGRGPRSMSAPPENRGEQVTMEEQKGGEQSEPQKRPNERIIPIHIEGRDEPITPKAGGQSFGQPSFGGQGYAQQPQPERIFGQSPSRFTQYIPEPSRRGFGRTDDFFYDQPHFGGFHNTFQQGGGMHSKGPFHQEKPQKNQFQGRRQESQPSHPQQPHPQQSHPQQSQQSQQYSQQNPQHPQNQSQQKQDAPNPDQNRQNVEQMPMSPQQEKIARAQQQILSINKEVQELISQAEKFTGKPKDKEYLYLDEMLTRNLIKLDNIDHEGQDVIRQARREAIKCIERCISQLEAKARANEGAQRPPEPMQTEEPVQSEKPSQAEEPSQTEQPKTLEVSGQIRTGTVAGKNSSGAIPMDVSEELPTTSEITSTSDSDVPMSSQVEASGVSSSEVSSQGVSTQEVSSQNLCEVTPQSLQEDSSQNPPEAPSSTDETSELSSTSKVPPTSEVSSSSSEVTSSSPSKPMKKPKQKTTDKSPVKKSTGKAAKTEKENKSEKENKTETESKTETENKAENEGNTENECKTETAEKIENEAAKLENMANKPDDKQPEADQSETKEPEEQMEVTECTAERGDEREKISPEKTLSETKIVSKNDDKKEKKKSKKKEKETK